MNARTIRKRMTVILISLLLCTLCMANTAFAYGNIDISQKTSVTVCFAEKENGFQAVNFRVYRVADVDQSGEFTLAGDFRSYPVSLKDMTSSKWRALSQTLNAYVQRDRLQPMKTEKTGTDGCVTFSDLTSGLYLITGDSCTRGGVTYTPEPMLVSLPDLTAENEWDYHPKVYCKYDRYNNTSTPERVQRKVQKVWKDDGNENKRPATISVQLLKNGNVADTVTLSEENNWEYTWKNLDSRYTWLVTEKEIPEGYTVTVQREGSVFIVTNTYPEEEYGEPPKEPTEEPPVEPSEKPPETSGQTTEVISEKTSAKLPQTGMLWWPVPLFVCGGLLFTIAGLAVRGGRKKK